MSWRGPSSRHCTRATQLRSKKGCSGVWFVWLEIRTSDLQLQEQTNSPPSWLPLDHLAGEFVCISLKLCGENTSFYGLRKFSREKFCQTRPNVWAAIQFERNGATRNLFVQWLCKEHQDVFRQFKNEVTIFYLIRKAFDHHELPNAGARS